MLQEIGTNEFITYIVKKRNPSDPYNERKIQKDRKKMLIWIKNLLENFEVIIFYLDNGIEKSKIGSMKTIYGPLPGGNISIEYVAGRPILEFQYCQFFEEPTREPHSIHADLITKFVVKNDPKVSELSKKLEFF